MKKYKEIILFLMIIFTVPDITDAQVAITTAGGSSSGSMGSVSYTIGQVVYSSSLTSSGNITAGVQQPYEITMITEIKEAKDIELFISAFPNPTFDNVTLKIDNYTFEKLICNLTDINGKQVISLKIINKETSVKLTNLKPSTYFMKILDNNKEIKVFKIIKAN
jgi:hypothetical protein